MKAVGRDGTKAISGHKEGRDEGAQLKAIEIATKMLSKGLMPAEIAEVTGLSEAEIDAIQGVEAALGILAQIQSYGRDGGPQG